jgi:pilus assembly protein Flp/PilA
MLSLIKRLYRHEGGATATEYAMLVVFIALAIAVGAQALGTGINTLFTSIGTEIGAVKPPAIPPTP